MSLIGRWKAHTKDHWGPGYRNDYTVGSGVYPEEDYDHIEQANLDTIVWGARRGVMPRIRRVNWTSGRTSEKSRREPYTAPRDVPSLKPDIIEHHLEDVADADTTADMEGEISLCEASDPRTSCSSASSQSQQKVDPEADSQSCRSSVKVSGPRTSVAMNNVSQRGSCPRSSPENEYGPPKVRDSVLAVPRQSGYEFSTGTSRGSRVSFSRVGPPSAKTEGSYSARVSSSSKLKLARTRRTHAGTTIEMPGTKNDAFSSPRRKESHKLKVGTMTSTKLSTIQAIARRATTGDVPDNRTHSIPNEEANDRRCLKIGPKGRLNQEIEDVTYAPLLTDACSMLTPQNIAELEAALGNSGIDCRKYGLCSAKTVGDLWDECARGKCCLVIRAGSKSCLRCINVIKVRLSVEMEGKRRHILQEKRTGVPHSERYDPLIDATPSRVMDPKESLELAATRCLKEKLSLDILWQNQHLEFLHGSIKHWEEECESGSYPGLRCLYSLHEVSVRIVRPGELFFVLSFPNLGTFGTTETRSSGAPRAHQWMWVAVNQAQEDLALKRRKQGGVEEQLLISNETQIIEKTMPD